MLRLKFIYNNLNLYLNDEKHFEKFQKKYLISKKFWKFPLKLPQIILLTPKRSFFGRLKDRQKLEESWGKVYIEPKIVKDYPKYVPQIQKFSKKYAQEILKKKQNYMLPHGF